MISQKYYNSRKTNTAQLLFDREYGRIERYVSKKLQSATCYIDRLELESVLEGHEGCVNCLEWSSNGRMLASGSDDFKVILWDPFTKKRLHTMKTKHLGNMFSVKFLPRSNDSLIATAAADKTIYVFDINRYDETILSCVCHTARVKRLAVAPDSPFVFWSAGEDGTVLQLDIRESHRCRSEDNRVRLLNLTSYLDVNAEAKCVAINPRRTEYLAVGANDPYARIYDRRMLSPTSSHSAAGVIINGSDAARPSSGDPSIPKDCVTYYCPGHINKNNSKVIEHEHRAITYLTFNAIGTELLVNMGGEHIYLYDLLHCEQPVFLNLPEYPPLEDSPGDGIVPAFNATNESSRRKIPENIENYKKMGNEFLENEKYLRAIDQYSEAIHLSPNCAVLYLNRATAFMRRQWYGDVYASLRDCHQALKLDPKYTKAHFRLARALLELGRAKEADECLKEFINRFPNYTNNHGVMMLRKDIKESTQSSAAQQQSDSFSSLELSDDEYQWRSKAKDYHRRFVGHCNTTTDIKEANYFGYDGEFIVAGSDDGNFFIWERETGKIRSVYKGDMAIVNCIQPHTNVCMMATSGIDHDIKIWSPIDDINEEKSYRFAYHDGIVESNQQKMKTDPFDLNTPTTFCRNS